MRTIVSRLTQRNEEGVALASSVMLSAFVFLIIMTLGMTIAAHTNITATTKQQAHRINNAESGIDHALYKAATHACEPVIVNSDLGYSVETYRAAGNSIPRSTADATLGCPQDGDNFVLFKATGTDAKGKQTTVTSVYQWVTTPEGHINGALVSGGGNVNISQLELAGTQADFIMLEGNLDCNSTSFIHGDVVIAKGSINISNNCRINNNLYTKQHVQINNTTAHIGGNIYALGDFRLHNPATISGQIYARGGVTLPWGSTIIVHKSFATPKPLEDGAHTWLDLDYEQNAFLDHGWSIRTMTASQCDLQNNAAIVNEINNASRPTVYDFTTCSNFQAYGINLNLQHDVTIVANRFDNFQAVRVSSRYGDEIEFNMITPDRVADGAPTCSSGQGAMNIHRFAMVSDQVSGMIYSPCRVQFGGASAINGQVIAGVNGYSAGGGTVINYEPIAVPGMPVETALEVTDYVSDVDQQTMPALVFREEL